MVNTFFLAQADQETLLVAQEQLKNLKSNLTASDKKIPDLINLLKIASRILRKESISHDDKVASWLFMAEVYGIICYVYSP